MKHRTKQLIWIILTAIVAISMVLFSVTPAFLF